MTNYPISPYFKRINRKMPYSKPLFRLAGPVQKLLLRCIPLDQALTANQLLLAGFQSLPIPATLFSPKSGSGLLPCLLLFHGGGFGYRAAPYHKKLAMLYARETGCKVLFPDYHLLPSYSYPAAKEDALCCYRFLASSGSQFGIDPHRILVAGDSAGAVLATYVVGADWKELPPPKGQMLLYPVLDAAQNTDSIRRYQDTPMWNSKNNAKMWNWYLDGTSPLEHQAASPMTAPLPSKIPPTYLETAEFDCLHDEGLLYAQRLKQYGGCVTLYETKGTIHGYDFCLNSPITQQSIRHRIHFLKKTL